MWLCGLTLRQSNAIQRVFYRTISLLKSECVCVCKYMHVKMFFGYDYKAETKPGVFSAWGVDL